MRMVIELAGIPMEVECRHEANRTFMKDYLSSRAPQISIIPTEKDFDDTAERLRSRNVQDGCPDIRYSDVFVENCTLHRLIVQQLVSCGVLLMHGSALCMDGRAYIFSAPSGTGKSTHARLWREVFGERVWMINDDKPLLRFSEQGVDVWGSPWDGKHRLSRNASASLQAVIFLRRGMENRIRPMTAVDAFPFLLSQTYSSDDMQTMEKIAGMQQILLRQIRFYRLECNMEPEAAMTAWKGVRGE